MAATVNVDECIGCQACVDECPVGAIAIDGDVAVIDADECLSCSACVDACPQSAIACD